MNKNKNILILTDDLQVGAVITNLSEKTQPVEIHDPSIQEQVEAVLLTIKTSGAKARVYGHDEVTGIDSIGFVEVMPGEDLYPQALVDLFISNGLLASISSKEVISLVKYVSSHMSKEKMQTILGDLLVMEDEEAVQFEKGLKDAQAILDKDAA